MRYEEFTLEGRNAVIEAYRAGKTIDKLFVLEHCKEGSMNTVLREAKKHDTVINYVKKERLDQMSETGKHQGVIGYLAAYEYATVDEILDKAREKGESPFVILLDDIEDPHNLGAIIRTANLAGAHGVIIPKHRASGLTATVAKTSAGALNYTPVATEALRESISPNIGIEATKSHFSFTSLLTPLPSFPITSPIEPLRSRSYIVVPPMSAQTNHIPSFFNSSIVFEMFVTLATGV